MPKAKPHWAHDLLAVAWVGGVSGLVFWLAPPAEPTKTSATVHINTCVGSVPTEYPACSVVTS
jgi:hypothetical protein